jgi:heat shock protein HslJ
MMKLMRIVAAFTLVAMMSALLGGASAKAAPTTQSTLPAEVLQYEWVLEYLNTDAKSAGQDLTSHQITIKFGALGTVEGFGGCNSYSGTYTVSGQQLTIADNLISTMMACEESVMAREQQYFRNLTSVNGYALNQSKLDLIYADGHNAMTYIPGTDLGRPGGQGEGSDLPAEILQAEWTLQHFNSNARAEQDVREAGITIKFDANHTFAGFAGCNNYNGFYTVSGQQLTIGDNIAVTRMACAGAPSLLESRYLELLPTVKSYTATASELQLVYGDDGAALVYVPSLQVMPVQPAVPEPQTAPQTAPPPPAPPEQPVAQPVAGMPQTGAGDGPFLTLLALVGALVALVTGVALRRRHAYENARK